MGIKFQLIRKYQRDSKSAWEDNPRILLFVDRHFLQFFEGNSDFHGDIKKVLKWLVFLLIYTGQINYADIRLNTLVTIVKNRKLQFM